MISNPQISNRLVHFLKADFKSAWTPGGELSPHLKGQKNQTRIAPHAPEGVEAL